MRTSRSLFAASVAIQDPQGRLLLVREGDPRVLGKYNLPGGHPEGDESPIRCAIRETVEETGLFVQPSSLLGLYLQGDMVSIVFRAEAAEDVSLTPGPDILSLEWLTLDEIARLKDDKILRPTKLRRIVSDIARDRRYPLEILRRVHVEGSDCAT